MACKTTDDVFSRFLRFLNKKHDFLRFFELLHTFSRTFSAVSKPWQTDTLITIICTLPGGQIMILYSGHDYCCSVGRGTLIGGLRVKTTALIKWNK